MAIKDIYSTVNRDMLVSEKERLEAQAELIENRIDYLDRLNGRISKFFNAKKMSVKTYDHAIVFFVEDKRPEILVASGKMFASSTFIINVNKESNAPESIHRDIIGLLNERFSLNITDKNLYGFSKQVVSDENMEEFISKSLVEATTSIWVS